MEELRIAVRDGHVSALLTVAEAARAMLVLAHGAGADMTHPFLASVAEALARRGVSTLRYRFPYMEAGTKRPDRPDLAQAAVHAAVAKAGELAPSLPLFAGGKSFGGRMTSQAEAAEPMQNLRGLIFLGFPLHPAGKPSTGRANHLSAIRVPMLFVQGTRDALADNDLLRGALDGLPTATLELIEDSDHSFNLPVRLARRRDVLDEVVSAVARWSLAHA